MIKKIQLISEYIGYNGCWTLNIDQPFYHWYHTATGQGMLIRP